MAVITKTIAEFVDPLNGSVCTWVMDYDDVDLVVRAVRCTNDTRSRVRGRLEKNDDSQRFYEVAVKNERGASVDVFADVARRLELTVDKAGRLDGLSFSFNFPGLIQARA